MSDRKLKYGKKLKISREKLGQAKNYLTLLNRNLKFLHKGNPLWRKITQHWSYHQEEWGTIRYCFYQRIGKNQQASRKLTQNRRPPSRIRAESTGQESKIAEIREEA